VFSSLLIEPLQIVVVSNPASCEACLRGSKKLWLRDASLPDSSHTSAERLSSLRRLVFGCGQSGASTEAGPLAWFGITSDAIASVTIPVGLWTVIRSSSRGCGRQIVRAGLWGRSRLFPD
jgi:hypothetical protein